MEFTPSVIFAIVAIVGVLVWLFFLRKNKNVAKEKNPVSISQLINNFPSHIVGFGLIGAIVLIQSIGYILSQAFGFAWTPLGFIIKGIAVAMLVYMVLSLIRNQWAVTAPQLVVLIITFAVLVFILIGLEKVIPQLFSTLNLFSASQIFG